MTEDRYSKNQREIIDDFQATFSSVVGRRTLDCLKQQSGYDDRIIPRGIDGIVGTLIDLGSRDLYLFIKDKMLADPNEQVQATANPEKAE